MAAFLLGFSSSEPSALAGPASSSSLEMVSFDLGGGLPMSRELTLGRDFVGAHRFAALRSVAAFLPLLWTHVAISSGVGLRAESVGVPTAWAKWPWPLAWSPRRRERLRAA